MSNENSVSEAARVEVLKMAVGLVEKVMDGSARIDGAVLRKLGFSKGEIEGNPPPLTVVEAVHKDLLTILEGTREVDPLPDQDS